MEKAYFVVFMELMVEDKLRAWPFG